MIDRRPAAILRCLGTTDVRAGVTFARERGLALCIKGGGHNISGLAVADDALMLDMSLMRGVWVDPDACVARAQAGCLLGDVDRETQLHGLAAALGFVSNTGIAGLTLGGGFGYLSRRFGWTCDTVRAFDLVTVDGRLVRATATDHPDLFWALRGGGGNFGVVTGFEYEVYPLGPEIYGGPVAWPLDDAPAVIEEYLRLVASGPQELSCVIAFRIAPPAPWIDKAIHGKPIVLFLACHSGDVGEGERLLATIKRIGHPAGDLLQRRPYVTLQSLLDATQPAGRRYYWKSEYLAGVTKDVVESARHHAQNAPSPHSAVIVFPFDGLLNTLPADHSPAGNRDARAVLNITAAWDDPAQDAANVEWARAVWRDMKHFSTGGTYVNFLTEEETADRISAAYGSHLDRLAAIKAVWDPDNLLRSNKNIVPRG
jgi:FAD/FMN-containing dehydrogenase